jgi:hypothetical protein
MYYGITDFTTFVLGTILQGSPLLFIGFGFKLASATR